MALDACVYCNCLEEGKISIAPNAKWGIYIRACGDRDISSVLEEDKIDFDKWNSTACTHPNGVFTYQYLGNIYQINHIKQFLSQFNSFEVILNKVIYSGSHAGDWIDLSDVKIIQKELCVLESLSFPDNQTNTLILDFLYKMKNFIKCSLDLQKPISF